MPFYKLAAMGQNEGKITPKLLSKSIAGEFMKAALVDGPAVTFSVKAPPEAVI